MLSVRVALLGSLLLGFLLLVARAGAAQERALGVKRLAFTVEVDVAKVRAQNWAGKDASDEQLVANASRLVQRRFDAMQRAAKIELEPGTKRFTVSLPSIDSRPETGSSAQRRSRISTGCIRCTARGRSVRALSFCPLSNPPILP